VTLSQLSQWLLIIRLDIDAFGGSFFNLSQFELRATGEITVNAITKMRILSWLSFDYLQQRFLNFKLRKTLNLSE
jgi:hypothetical protein